MFVSLATNLPHFSFRIEALVFQFKDLLNWPKYNYKGDDL